MTGTRIGASLGLRARVDARWEVVEVHSIRRSLITLCVLSIAAMPVTGQESEEGTRSARGTQGPPLKNIRVTITYDTTEAGGKKVVTTREVVAQERSRATLLIGSRVPIATTRAQGDGEDDDGSTPVTSYTYQNVGFSADLRAWVLPDGRISLEAQMESSRVSPHSADAEHPVILTYQQQIQVVLEEGKPMRVTRVEDPERLSGHFELTAEVVE